MKKYLQVEPVRSLASLLALGSAVIVIVAFKYNIDGETVAGVQAAWAAFIGFVGSFFTRNQVTPVVDPKDENGNSLTKV